MYKMPNQTQFNAFSLQLYTLNRTSMAQKSSPSPSPSPPRRRTPSPQPQYVEVSCRSSGKTRRFAAGTDAGFAVELMNRKLNGTVAAALAFHIEAVKEGEVPIAFGPNSILCNFGQGWKLQTVTFAHLSQEVANGQFQQTPMQTPGPVPGAPGPARRVSNPISFVYFVKIMLAFILIFVLGAIFTLFLDNLPEFISFLKSII